MRALSPAGAGVQANRGSLAENTQNAVRTALQKRMQQLQEVYRRYQSSKNQAASAKRQLEESERDRRAVEAVRAELKTGLDALQHENAELAKEVQRHKQLVHTSQVDKEQLEKLKAGVQADADKLQTVRLSSSPRSLRQLCYILVLYSCSTSTRTFTCALMCSRTCRTCRRRA